MKEPKKVAIGSSKIEYSVGDSQRIQDTIKAYAYNPMKQNEEAMKASVYMMQNVQEDGITQEQLCGVYLLSHLNIVHGRLDSIVTDANRAIISNGIQIMKDKITNRTHQLPLEFQKSMHLDPNYSEENKLKLFIQFMDEVFENLQNRMKL